MRTQFPRSRYLLLLVAGLAVILFSTAGIAAIMGWRSASNGNYGNHVALGSPDAAPMKGEVVSVRSAQKRAQTRARANGTCAECGLIVSMAEIDPNDEDFRNGAPGTMGVGHQAEAPLISMRRYEIIVRMADGTSRVINHGSPASWRVGERIMIINGAKPLHR